MKSLMIEARLYFDKSGGNTYHATRVHVDGILVAALPLAYGYGDAWLNAAGVALTDLGLATPDEIRHTFHGLRRRGVAVYTPRPVYVTKKEAREFGAVDVERYFDPYTDDDAVTAAQEVADALAKSDQVHLANMLLPITGVEYCTVDECENPKPCFLIHW